MPRRVVTLSASLLALVTPCFASPVPVPSGPATLTWTACPIAETNTYTVLGTRVRCARLPVPVDHLDPTRGTLELGVIRIRASRAVERKGAIFVNFGGPGGSPMRELPDMAADWAVADPLDDMAVSRKRLLDHFDFIGVVPRGMQGGWTFECMPPVSSSYAFIPTNTDDTNMRKVETQAGGEARTCRENPFSAYVNTEQNARDMEFVRRALGEPKLNYLGISYGTWLGSWYASMYPQHVGRMATPVAFVAAMRIDGWVKSDPGVSLAALARRVSKARFNEDATIDEAARAEATRMVAALFDPAPMAGPLPARARW